MFERVSAQRDREAQSAPVWVAAVAAAASKLRPSAPLHHPPISILRLIPNPPSFLPYLPGVIPPHVSSVLRPGEKPRSHFHQRL